MGRKSEHIETAFCNAYDLINSFFGDDEAAFSTFYALCEHMISIDSGFVIRSGEDIIGLCRSGEFYRFYVLKENGQNRIKFQHYTERIVFDTRAIDLYLADCDVVNAYFEKNISRWVLKSELRKQEAEARFAATVADRNSVKRLKRHTPIPRIPEIWDPVRKAVTAALDLHLDRSIVYTERSGKVYGELVEILTAACRDPEMLRESAGAVILNRVVYCRRATLEELGARYGVTRERVRQVQNKQWQRLSRRFSKHDTVYTRRMVEVFQGLNGVELIGAIAYIARQNEFLGEWLVNLLAVGEQRFELAIAIQQII